MCVLGLSRYLFDRRELLMQQEVAAYVYPCMDVWSSWQIDSRSGFIDLTDQLAVDYFLLCIFILYTVEYLYCSCDCLWRAGLRVRNLCAVDQDLLAYKYWIFAALEVCYVSVLVWENFVTVLAWSFNRIPALFLPTFWLWFSGDFNLHWKIFSTGLYS